MTGRLLKMKIEELPKWIDNEFFIKNYSKYLSFEFLYWWTDTYGLPSNTLLDKNLYYNYMIIAITAWCGCSNYNKDSIINY